MNKLELNNRLFETILTAAVEENFQRELKALPSEEALRNEFTPSPELKQRIQKIIKKSYHQLVRRKAAAIAKKAAVIIAIIIPISLASLLSVEASRIAIFNTVVEWKSDYVNIYFQENSSGQSSQDTNGNNLYKPQYLPDGFIEIETVKFGATQRIKYQNDKNVSIIFDQTPLSEGGTTILDREHTIYKEIILNGRKASLFAAKTPEDKTYIVWQSSKTSFKLYSIIDEKELIKMAENIDIKNN